MDFPLDCRSGSGEALVDLPRCARRGFFRAPPGCFRGAAFGGGNCRGPPRQAGRLLARPRSRRKKGAQGDFRLGRPARATPGARYARRPISGLRAAFGGWPPKRGLRTAVAGAPPRGPGLSPLRGPGPADRILYQDGLRPNPCDPRAASGWPAAKVDGALSRISGRAYSIPPAAAPRAQCLCPGVSGTVPGVRFGEARPLLRGAQRPQGGGKLRGFAAHARKARERPVRALFSAAGLGQPSGLGRWVRPQPELSPQLVYPWGAAVTCGLWQGTPGGFSRGLAEVPLSALLPPTSWAPKKSARPPGRVPAFPPPQAAHLKRPGGARKKPRRAQRGKKIKAPPSRAYAETTCPFRSAVRFSKARGAFHRCS